MMNFTFQTIGIIHSCFKENFGIPRQSGLVSEAKATIEVFPSYGKKEAFRGLDEFSHIWVLFIFHSRKGKSWKPTVRPPRLGGNEKVGVYATRSPFRPNPIGISVVELEKIVHEKNKTLLYLNGVDFLDSTPVIDIKPYISYSDSIPQAVCGFASQTPSPCFKVEFTPSALEFCERRKKNFPDLERLINQLLQFDTRPAYYSQSPIKKLFGMKLFNLDVKWTVNENIVTVLSIDENPL